VLQHFLSMVWQHDPGQEVGFEDADAAQVIGGVDDPVEDGVLEGALGAEIVE
jgi:hypothetical protein